MRPLPRNTILAGDAETVLAGLLPESVDSVITSPPYFRLRNYGAGPHELGQETAVCDWVARLRSAFRGLARVLKPEGSVWLNVSDTYSRSLRMGAPPKSLLLGPERLIQALSADGWIVRNKLIWAKPDPLPSSVRDRLSPTHELVYLLTRSPRYYFDLDAIRVPHRSAHRARPQTGEVGRTYVGGNGGLGALKAAGRVGHRNGKNPGDVWTVPTACYRGEHFATFPPRLIEPMLLATVPERICEQCDTAWRRPVRNLAVHTSEGVRHVRKVGELQRCDCFALSRPGVVLDPFFGTGTVGQVAERHNRDWLGIELNRLYRAMARRRLGTLRRAA